SPPPHFFVVFPTTTRHQCAHMTPRPIFQPVVLASFVTGGNSGQPIPERDYCIVHVLPRTTGAADLAPCAIAHCQQPAHYAFWTHDPRPTGLVWVGRLSLCAAHAEAWCTAHEVDITAIPTIAARAWAAR